MKYKRYVIAAVIGVGALWGIIIVARIIALVLAAAYPDLVLPVFASLLAAGAAILVAWVTDVA